jgi:hypothetical protein
VETNRAIPTHFELDSPVGLWSARMPEGEPMSCFHPIVVGKAGATTTRELDRQGAESDVQADERRSVFSKRLRPETTSRSLDVLSTTTDVFPVLPVTTPRGWPRPPCPRTRRRQTTDATELKSVTNGARGTGSPESASRNVPWRGKTWLFDVAGDIGWLCDLRRASGVEQCH